jgi:hypothetical protein
MRSGGRGRTSMRKCGRSFSGGDGKSAHRLVAFCCATSKTLRPAVRVNPLNFVSSLCCLWLNSLREGRDRCPADDGVWRWNLHS